MSVHLSPERSTVEQLYATYQYRAEDAYQLLRQLKGPHEPGVILLAGDRLTSTHVRGILQDIETLEDRIWELDPRMDGDAHLHESSFSTCRDLGAYAAYLADRRDLAMLNTEELSRVRRHPVCNNAYTLEPTKETIERIERAEQWTLYTFFPNALKALIGVARAMAGSL